MSCKTCEVLQKQVDYLQTLVDKLLTSRDIEPILPQPLSSAMEKMRDEMHDENITTAEGM